MRKKRVISFWYYLLSLNESYMRKFYKVFNLIFVMGLEKDLLKRMKEYRYGRYNLIKDNFDFKYDLKGNIKIKKFYVGNKAGEGDCVKLTNDFCVKNPDLGLVKVEGNEPKYFHGESSNHLYTLLFKRENLDEFWKLNLEDKKYLIKKFNPFVIDPSFKLILPFNESKYSIKKFYEYQIGSSSNLNFENSENYVGVPLGLKSNKELVFLGKKNGKISLNFKFPEYKIHNNIYLEDISRIRGTLLNDTDLQTVCTNLSKKYIEFIENIKKPKLNLFNIRKAGL
jgi:hypothetical protein